MGEKSRIRDRRGVSPGGPGLVVRWPGTADTDHGNRIKQQIATSCSCWPIDEDPRDGPFGFIIAPAPTLRIPIVTSTGRCPNVVSGRGSVVDGVPRVFFIGPQTCTAGPTSTRRRWARSPTVPRTPVIPPAMRGFTIVARMGCDLRCGLSPFAAA